MSGSFSRIAAGILAATLLTAGGAPGADSPRNALIGTWQCDTARSTFTGAMPYRSARSTFSEVDGATHVVVDIVEANGVALHFEYRDPEDGEFVPVHGNPFYDKESTVWVDDRTARRTERRGDKDTGVTTMTVAADGKSYVTTARRTLPNGRVYTSEIHWKRVEP